MPTYMTQFSYTNAAAASLVKNPEDRGAIFSEQVEKLGGQVLALCRHGRPAILCPFAWRPGLASPRYRVLRKDLFESPVSARQMQGHFLDEPYVRTHQPVELRAVGQGGEGTTEVLLGVAVEISFAGESGEASEDGQVMTSVGLREASGPGRRRSFCGREL